MKKLSDKIDETDGSRGEITANEFNDRFKEEENVISNSGEIFNENSETQLLESIDYISKRQIYDDIGGKNVYAIKDRKGFLSEIKTLKNFISIKILIKNTNDGASTLNYRGLGNIAIFDTTMKELGAGALESGKVYELYYNGIVWVLVGRAGDKVIYYNNIPPTQTSNPVSVGCVWVDTQTDIAYMCVDSSKNLNKWLKIGGSLISENESSGGGGYTETSYLKHYIATETYDKDEIVLGVDGACYISLIQPNNGNNLNNATKWKQLTSKPLLENLTFQIPTDFQTINDCLNYVTKNYYPTNKNYKVTINLMNCFTCEEQIITDGENLGWIEITSDVQSIEVDNSSFTKQIMVDYETLDEYKPFICADNGGVSPVIRTHFTFLKDNGIVGGLALNNGTIIFKPILGSEGLKYCGFKDIVYEHSLVSINGGNIVANWCRFTHKVGVSNTNIIIADNANISVIHTIVEGSSGIGVEVKRGGLIRFNEGTGSLSQATNCATKDGIIYTDSSSGCSGGGGGADNQIIQTMLNTTVSTDIYTLSNSLYITAPTLEMQVTFNIPENGGNTKNESLLEFPNGDRLQLVDKDDYNPIPIGYLVASELYTGRVYDDDGYGYPTVVIIWRIS